MIMLTLIELVRTHTMKTLSEKFRLCRQHDLFIPALLAAGFIVLSLAFVNQYGYFRDELYYIACSNRLDFGYVDQPPLSIFVLKFMRTLFGDSLLAIRLLPIICGAALIILTSLITRKLGGGRFSQVVIGCSVLAAPIYIAVSNFYSMNVIDFVIWTGGVYWLMITLDRNNLRDWIVLGVLLGLGLLNKIGVLWLGAGIFLGLLLTHHRTTLKTPGPWIAGIIALALFSPYLFWQMSHEWATLEFVRNASQYKNVAVSPLDFFANQLILMNPLIAPVWITGLLCCLFAPILRQWRILAWIFVTVLTILLSSGSAKAYYLSPAYPAIIACGAVALEYFTQGGLHQLRVVMIIIVAGAALMSLPMSKPLLSPQNYLKYERKLGISPPREEVGHGGTLPQHYADMFGWEELVATLSDVYQQLPEEDRESCLIWVQNYGEAGAIEFWQAQYEVPRVVCPHNNYWLWAPRDVTANTWIILGGNLEDVQAVFETAEQVGSFEHPWVLDSQNNNPIYVGRNPKISLEQILIQAKNFM
jgi:hypothetical protein